MDASRARRRVTWLDAPAEQAAPREESRSGPSLQADPRFPDWKREGEFLYRRRQLFAGRGVEAWPEPFSPDVSSADELVFYDTETTGMGGAGTVIFLFGAAWCEGPDLAVEQLFLSDFPGEPEFLMAVREILGRFRLFVSYNGKTFDSHVLRTRFLMNRIPWEPGPQVDLLHHSRRLWKAVTGDCSLKAIESRVLGFDREGDVDGAEIPLIWLDFLRSGRPGTLPVVFDHNSMDIVSLARVHALIGRILGGDLSAAPVDGRAFGRWMLRHVPDTGALILSDAWDRGSAEAGISLSLHHKRRGEWKKAVSIWGAILGRTRSVFAALEMAKYLEHRERRPDAALQVVETMLSWELPLDRLTREAVRARVARLRRKITARGAVLPAL
jgi:uncharacterized protein